MLLEQTLRKFCGRTYFLREEKKENKNADSVIHQISRQADVYTGKC